LAALTMGCAGAFCAAKPELRAGLLSVAVAVACACVFSIAGNTFEPGSDTAPMGCVFCEDDCLATWETMAGAVPDVAGEAIGAAGSRTAGMLLLAGAAATVADGRAAATVADGRAAATVADGRAAATGAGCAMAVAMAPDEGLCVSPVLAAVAPVARGTAVAGALRGSGVTVAGFAAASSSVMAGIMGSVLCRLGLDSPSAGISPVTARALGAVSRLRAGVAGSVGD
jgi:hypothetical protein